MNKTETAQAKYIKLLENDIEQNCVFLKAHMITTPQEVIDRGHDLRTEIKQLKELKN